jgi:phosphoglycolate phosphatase
LSELEFQVEHHGISNIFEILSGAGDYYGGSKLDRGLALKKEYGFKNGVLVGDTLHDVEIGKEMGFETVWVSEGHQSLKRAEQSSAVDYILNRSTENFYKNIK